VYRHRFDPSAAVAGLLFLTIAAGYLTEGFGGSRVAFACAVPLLFAGLLVIGFVRLLCLSRRHEPEDHRSGRSR
jgi:hypothetical protein